MRKEFLIRVSKQYRKPFYFAVHSQYLICQFLFLLLDTNHLQDTSSPGNAGSSNGSSRLLGGGIQAGKIGRQIADEVLENQRRNDSSSNSPVSPFEGILGSGASDRSFAALLRSDLNKHRVSILRRCVAVFL